MQNQKLQKRKNDSQEGGDISKKSKLNLQDSEESKKYDSSLDTYLTRERKNVSQKNRRLDSLARLLEGESTCVAVCFIDNTVFITCNELKDIKKGEGFSNKHATLMQNLLNHLLKYAVTDSLSDKLTLEKNNDEGKKAEIHLLTALGNASINAKKIMKDGWNFGFSPNIIENSLIEKIVESLLQDKTQINWMLQGQEVAEQHLSEDDKTFWNNIKTTTRKEFSPENRKKTLMIKDKLDTINLCYKLCWRLIRDYKKVKKFFKNNTITTFNLLSIGEDNEHAEMRMIGYLLETGKISLSDFTISPIYIGISKLCCAHCACAIHTVNEVIKTKIGLTFSEPDNTVRTVESDNLQEFSQNKFKENVIEKAGQHGLSFNWVTPMYLKGKSYLSTHSKINIISKESAKINAISDLVDIREQIGGKLCEQFKSNKKILKTAIESKQKSKDEKSHINMQHSPSHSDATSIDESSPQKPKEIKKTNIEESTVTISLFKELEKSTELTNITNNYK